MTDLLERVRRIPAEASGGGGYQRVGTSALAALWSLAAGLSGLTALVLVGWLVDDTGVGPADAAQVSLQAFLLAHGSGLTTSWGEVGLIPLGLTALPAWLLVRAGAAVARRRMLATLGQVTEAVVALAIVYGVLATMLTAVATSSAVAIPPWRAGLGAAVLALVGATVGALRVTGLGLLPIGRLPGPRRAVAAAVVAGGLSLLAGGLAVVALAVALDVDRYAELSRAVAPTGSGAVGLGLLGVLLLPNAAVSAIAAGVGPGFALGRGTTVGLGGVELDSVPALPLLAALPDSGTPPYAAALIPLVTGLVVGVVLARRLDREDERGVLTTAVWAALAGVVVAALLGGACYLAGGPLGAGELATVGPSGWRVASFAAAELATLAALAAAVTRWRHLHR